MSAILPQTNDHLYFIDKLVVIVKVFLDFQLAKVRYLNSTETFIVDINVLKLTADHRSSISINLLGV
ncbi:hypothetical protein Q0V21_31930 [Paenibacillus sp. 11B]|uniref:hypothetical protein n=1 Tax=unclassified Paenibacillus TaxID=185978 RepID=UPI002651ED9F|nr:hypothetical protein [Paenibacillus sp. 11B]MDN8593345.1 hypothetical protein [Paenibacillus sp. 11B]